MSALTRQGRLGDEGASISARLSGGALVSTGFVDSPTTINQLTVQGPAGRLELSPLEYDGLRFTPSTAFPGDLGARARRVREALAQLPRGLRTLRQGASSRSPTSASGSGFWRRSRDGAPVLCPLDEGQRALQVALAAVASDARGRTVEVPEAPRDLSAALEGSQ